MVVVATSVYSFIDNPITYSASPLTWTQIDLIAPDNTAFSPNQLPYMVNSVRINNTGGSLIVIGVGGVGNQQIVAQVNGGEDKTWGLMLSANQNIWIAPYDIDATDGEIYFNFMHGRLG